MKLLKKRIDDDLVLKLSLTQVTQDIEIQWLFKVDIEQRSKCISLFIVSEDFLNWSPTHWSCGIILVIVSNSGIYNGDIMIHILYKFSSTLKLCDACYFNFFLRDAWTNLGDMPQEEAMVKYVEELKKVRHMYRVLNYSLSSLLFFRTLINWNFWLYYERKESLIRGYTEVYIENYW